MPHQQPSAKVDIKRTKDKKKGTHTESESSITKTGWYLLEGGIRGSNKTKRHFTLTIGPYELDAGNPDLHYTPYLRSPVLAFQAHSSQQLL